MLSGSVTKAKEWSGACGALEFADLQLRQDYFGYYPLSLSLSLSFSLLPFSDLQLRQESSATKAKEWSGACGAVEFTWRCTGDHVVSVVIGFGVKVGSTVVV
ncbi:hypothetical protein L2E82_45032 [Cichorium intybus]|uniref:Uncharacterized protein n=1 Tax=Cichorium intybus TaxID=13427 RepID=A0ACB8ZSU7_CICIN|nr:hypothetical protein L2E82_45032 [Cichorium intybus]